MEDNQPTKPTSVWRAPELSVVGVTNEPFGTLFTPFREAGYHPIPLHKAQKRPVPTKFNQFADPAVSIGKGHIDTWLRNHADGNMGLVCGRPVAETEDGRPLHVTAIDIDTNDERVWDAVTGAIPDWERAIIKTSMFKGVDLTRARGCTLIVLSPLAFTYGKKYTLDRLPKEDHVKGAKQPHIDFIASGMQTAIAGMHPETQRPYIITHGLDEKTGWVRPVTELPIFDQVAFDKLAKALEFARTDPMLSPEHEQTTLGCSSSTSRPRDRNLGGERTSEGLSEFIKGVERILSRDWIDPENRANYHRLFGQMADLWRVINEGELTETEALLILMGTDVHNAKLTKYGQSHIDGEWRRAQAYVKGECQTGAQIVADRQAAKIVALGWDDRLTAKAVPVGTTANKVTPDQVANRAIVEQSIEDADKHGVEMPERPNLSDMRPLPDSVAEAAPGLIGHLVDEMLLQNQSGSKTLAVSTALSIVGQIGSRRCFGAPVGNTLPCRFYIINLMPTSAGKNFYPQFARRITTELIEASEKDQRLWIYNYGNCEERFKLKYDTFKDFGGTQKPTEQEHLTVFEHWRGSAGFTGASAVWGEMWHTATPHIIIDEYGEVADSMSKANGPGGSAFTPLRTFYADVGPEVQSGYAINNENKPDLTNSLMRRKPIYSPSPNLIAYSTPEQVFTGGGGDSSRIKDGTLNRVMFFYDELPQRTEQDTHNFLWGSRSRHEIDPDLIAKIKQVVVDLHRSGEVVGTGRYFNTMDDVSDAFARTTERKIIGYDSPETQALITKQYHTYYAQAAALVERGNSVNTGHGQMLGRVAENFARVAFACAIADPHPTLGFVVQKHHVEWAAAVLDNVAHNIGSIYKTQMASHRENKATEDEIYLYEQMRKVLRKFEAGGYEKDVKNKNAVREVEGRLWVKRFLVRQAADKNKRTTVSETQIRLLRAGVVDMITVDKEGEVTAGRGTEYITADEAFDSFRGDE